MDFSYSENMPVSHHTTMKLNKKCCQTDLILITIDTMYVQSDVRLNVKLDFEADVTSDFSE